MQVQLKNVTLETIQKEAAARGMTEELGKITTHDFGEGRLTLTAYPGNPAGAELLEHLSEIYGGTRTKVSG